MYNRIKEAIVSVVPSISHLDDMVRGIIIDQSTTPSEVRESLGFYEDLFAKEQFYDVCHKVAGAIETAANPDAEIYSIFYKDGDEATDEYLNIYDAVSLSNSLEDDGYEIIIAKAGDDGQWVTVYES